MQLYSYQVALRIWHPSVDPAVITKSLGLKPAVAHRVGDPRVAPKGQPLGGLYAETYWHCDPFDYGERPSTDGLAEDAVTEVLTVLRPHSRFLLLLREQGGRLMLQISSFSARNYAIELPPPLMAELSSLGLSFAHDVYPCAQR